MSRGPLVVIGDALLDVDLAGTTTRLAPDAPVPVVDEVVERARPGGAALAAYLAAAGTDRQVVLLAPLAGDDAARRLRGLLSAYVTVVALPWDGTTPVKTRVRAAGQTLLRVDTGGAAGRVGPLPPGIRELLAGAAAVLVADYGRGVTSAPQLRGALADLPARIPVVWDPHPRGAEPLPGLRLVTPNRAEAALFAAPLGLDGALSAATLPGVQARARALASHWRAGAVAVTLGPDGALLSLGEGTPMVVPAPPVASADPCGAGDRFAATAACLLADGALPSEAVEGAVAAASAYVHAGGAAGLPALFEPAAPALRQPPLSSRTTRSSGPVARVRQAGGTVVATGGCFDLLHVGHVETLRAARQLGDCLVVCLNSDASVRRLKGPERPLQRQDDRARVLEALECVDAVEVFDEDTPEAVLDRLRPDLWVKGGDYAGVELPENALLRSWGGSAVVLPYLAGRSTTQLVHAARATWAPRSTGIDTLPKARLEETS